MMLAGVCRHYNNNRKHGPICRMGHCDRVETPGRTCISSPQEVCPDRQDPTAEEIAAQEKAAEDAFAKTLGRLVEVIEVLPDKIECGTFGAVGCPFCEPGKLHWSRASNGHVWLQCDQHGCFEPTHLAIDRKASWPV